MDDAGVAPVVSLGGQDTSQLGHNLMSVPK